jgi:hypothetical protein
MSEEAYVCQCPKCKEIQGLNVKYCVKCRHWLLDSNFPATTMTKDEYIKYYNSSVRPKGMKKVKQGNWFIRHKIVSFFLALFILFVVVIAITPSPSKVADSKFTIITTSTSTKMKKSSIIATPTATIPKEFELSNGNYISGTDFTPGIYDIVAIEGYGNVSSSNYSNGGINTIMGIENNYQKQYKNVHLPKDVELKIMNLKVKLLYKKSK